MGKDFDTATLRAALQETGAGTAPVAVLGQVDRAAGLFGRIGEEGLLPGLEDVLVESVLDARRLLATTRPSLGGLVWIAALPAERHLCAH